MKVYLDGDEFWPHYSAREARGDEYVGFTSGVVEVDEATYERWCAAIELNEKVQEEMDNALIAVKGER